MQNIHLFHGNWSLHPRLKAGIGPYHIEGGDQQLPLFLHHLCPPPAGATQRDSCHISLPVSFTGLLWNHSSLESHSLFFTERKKSLLPVTQVICNLRTIFHNTKKELYGKGRQGYCPFHSFMGQGGGNLEYFYKKPAPVNKHLCIHVALFINIFRMTKSDFMQEINILICLMGHYWI